MHLDCGMILFVIKNDRNVIDEQVYKLELQISYLIVNNKIVFLLSLSY